MKNNRQVLVEKEVVNNDFNDYSKKMGRFELFLRVLRNTAI